MWLKRSGRNVKIAQRLQLKQVELIARKQVEGIEGGSGVIGTLPEAMTAEAFIQLLKQQFNISCLQTNELLQRPIKRVAICGGAGGFLWGEAIKARADAFITGEMHYHDYFDHEQQIQICVMGHYQSEQFTANLLQEILQQHCPDVTTHITKINTNPILYF